MWKIRLIALIFILAGAGLGFFVYSSEINPDSRFPLKLGLDLSGGTHLLYHADISGIESGGEKDAVESLRDVIERRINLFGVAEPVVQVEKTSGVISQNEEYRLIVELPGVTDVDAAVQMIGQTPLLEFKKEGSAEDIARYEEAFAAYQKAQEEGDTEFELDAILITGPYEDTGLTGRFLKRAVLEFDGTTNEPIVAIEFDDTGAGMFEDLTGENIGKTIAIYLDGAPISTPVVNEKISGGSAQISGNFRPDEARELVGRLNSGALPVPISLISTQTVGPSLGKQAYDKGVSAGVLGLAAVAIFLIIWYRLPGVLAVVALCIYIALMLALFKIIPVTLTAAGIAGFILSIGMAVDANILIFERMKEELAKNRMSAEGGSAFGGKEELRKQDANILSSAEEGFARAWLSIRDGNISSIITAIILFWFGTSLVKGFALTFGIGVLVSMISAIAVTRTFLYSVAAQENRGFARFLFGTGITRL